MNRYIARRDRGLTLTELLVVMLIIGLLSTVAIPVYIGRMEDARVRVAQAEARELGQAEEQCALLHGYYVPLQFLDDQAKPRIANQFQDRIDLESPRSGFFVINPLIPPDLQFGNQESLNSTKPRVIDIIEKWQGPFMTFQRFYVPPGFDSKDVNYQNDPVARRDYPLDPWGEPYRFYSPIGAVGSNATAQAPTSGYDLSFSNGTLSRDDDRNLERYAIVSYGRDNRPNAGASRDDILYLFGTSGVESDFGQL